MLSTTNQTAYRRLVQQLMDLGWYRVGPGPSSPQERMTWGFREGHLIDVRAGQTRWIAARDEQTAMHSLLTELTAAPRRLVG